MKKYNLIRPSFFATIVSTLLIFVVSSCATKTNFAHSIVVPAAEGYVKVKKDHNKNFIIQIQIFNLAKVEQLEDSKKTYVVWMVSNNEEAKNIGRLKSAKAFFSKNLRATFTSVSSIKPDKIFITDENNGETNYPSGQIVLSTDHM